MKGILCLAVICVLAGCNSGTRLKDNTSVENYSNDPKPAIHKVYAEYKGPKRAALRFSRVLEVALMDHDLELVNDRGAAEAVVNVTIEEEKGKHSVYGELLKVNFSLPTGKTYTDDSCVSVSTAPRLPGEIVTWTHVGERLKKSNPSVTRVFLGPLENDQNAGLRRTLMWDLAAAGYTLVSAREQADAVLESARIHVEEIPITGLQQKVLIDASVRVWPKYSFSSNTTGYFHESVAKPVPEQARDCAIWAETQPYSLNMWNAADALARSLTH